MLRIAAKSVSDPNNLKFAGPAADAAGRAKQMRFLAARGFGGDVIGRVLRGGEED